MEGTKRVSLNPQKKFKRKNYRRLVRNIVAYLKSDVYLFKTQIQTHPPSSNSESSKINDISVTGFEAVGIKKVIKKKRRMSEKVKEYLKSDCYMYGSMISPPPKLGSSLKDFEAGKMQITNLVTMEVSTSTTDMKEDNNNYRNLRSDIAEQTLLNGRINSPKRAIDILKGQQTGQSSVSPAFSSLPEEKMVKPNQRRVTIER